MIMNENDARVIVNQLLEFEESSERLWRFVVEVVQWQFGVDDVSEQQHLPKVQHDDPYVGVASNRGNKRWIQSQGSVPEYKPVLSVDLDVGHIGHRKYHCTSLFGGF